MTDASEAGPSIHSVTSTVGRRPRRRAPTMSRVVGEGVGEGLLRLGLEPVVQLLGDPLLQLGDQRLDVDAGEDRRDARAPAGRAGLRSPSRASPAPGYCTLTATSRPSCPAAPVHLADRRRRGRAVVEPDQPVPPVRAELAAELVAHRRGRHRRRRVLQLGQVLAVRRRHLLGQRRLEHRQRLAELHRAALELAQGAEQLLGGALLDVGQHGLGRLAAEPLAEPQRAATGVPQGRAASRAVRATALRGRSVMRPVSQAHEAGAAND